MPEENTGAVTVPKIPDTVIVVDSKLQKEVAALEEAITTKVIKTDADNEDAAKVLDRVGKLIKEVEANKKAVNKPFYTVSRMISAAAKPYLDRLEEAKAAHKKNMATYYLAREEERAEQERKAEAERQAEAKRLAAEEEQRQAQHRAAMAEPPVKDTGGITLKAPGEAPVVTPSVPPPLPAPVPAPPPAPMAGVTIKSPEAKASGTKVTKKIVLSVTKGRVTEVPREYCSPDKDKIQAAFDRGEITPEIHQWLTVEEVTDISSTGRG